MNSARNILTLITIFVIGFNFLSCKNISEKVKKSVKFNGSANIEFLDTIHDFGTLKEGEIAEYSFKYKNTGEAPLKIKKIVTDCGCTVPEYDKKPLLPGENAKIKVTFDSQGFRNNIYKTITVKTNTKSKNKTLVLTAFIQNNNNLNY